MEFVRNFILVLTLVLTINGCGGGNTLRDDNSSLKAKTENTPTLTTNIEILDQADRYKAYVSDGDTIKLYFDGTKTTIRLIGIDTFESHKNNKAYRQAYENNITIDEVLRRGKMASEYLKNLLKDRDEFYLEYDEEFLDRYHRTLGYVWLDGHTQLNLKIICEGYAMPLTIPPNDRYASKYIKCYENAKRDHLGVWK